jgi:hypothetical protein
MIRAREGGFTLIEIVVSLGLATLVLVGTLGFINAQSRSHRDSMELQTMQMGLRVGLEKILRDTRSASAGFSIGTINIQDTTAYTNLGVGNVPAVWLGSNPALNQTNTGAGGSDVLNLVFADGRGVTNTTKDASGVITQTTNTPITVLDARGFVGVASYPDNFVIVSDVSNTASAGSNAILARVNAAAFTTWPAGTITLAAMPGGNPFPVPSFQGGSLVLTASALTYSIDTAVFGSTEPALVMVRGGPLNLPNLVPDPLATQIEDLQVALGYDGLNAGVVDGYVNENVAAGANLDEWAFNLTGDTLTGAIATLRAVRVTLVARSVNTRAIGVGPLTVEDHVPGSGANYLRRRLTGVASVRNLAF